MTQDKLYGIVHGILESKIEDEIFEELIKITENSIKNNENYSNKLAGKIYKVTQNKVSSEELTKNLDIIEYITRKSETYLKKIGNRIFLDKKFKIKDAWVVSQYENDYNPLHIHSGTLSGIIYLKIPPQISKRDEEYLNRVSANSPIETDGKIEFVLHSGPTDNLFYHFINRKMLITPKEKYMYLFPSWLMHTVYPFSGKGERRTFAFNLDL